MLSPLPSVELMNFRLYAYYAPLSYTHTALLLFNSWPCCALYSLNSLSVRKKKTNHITITAWRWNRKLLENAHFFGFLYLLPLSLSVPATCVYFVRIHCVWDNRKRRVFLRPISDVQRDYQEEWLMNWL